MKDLYLYSHECNLPFFNLWVGELIESQYRLEETIYVINDKYFTERDIKIDDIFNVKIKKGNIQTKQFRPYNHDKGMCMCGRSYLMAYVLQSFENEIRKKVGYKYKMRPSYTYMEKMIRNYSAPLVSETIKLYSSEEFTSVIQRALDKAL